MENIQEKMLAAVRQVIGDERMIHQGSAFEDSISKVVTVRYEGVTDGEILQQQEAAKIIAAFMAKGFLDFQVRLFVTDPEGQNVGSIDVKLPIGGLKFTTVGNKWVGKEADELNPNSKGRIFGAIKADSTIRDALRRFKAELMAKGSIQMEGEGESGVPELSHQPGTGVDGNREHFKRIVKGAESGDDFVDADFFKRASQMLADDAQRNLFEGRFLPEDDNDAE